MPGFLVRAALAARCPVYGGCIQGSNSARRRRCPDARNISNSEKYQIRVVDCRRAGNIVAEITALNRIRRAHPALQTHLGLTFYPAFNDQVLLYGKRTPGGRE